MPTHERFVTPVLGCLAWVVMLLGAVGPAIAQSSTSEGKLKAEIARIAAASQGVVGVAAIHLPSGRRVDVNSDEPFEMASTLKLPLALYAIYLGERGKIPLKTALPV